MKMCTRKSQKLMDSTWGAIAEDKEDPVSRDVTVNQHFPFPPPGPHAAHQHSRTWRGTA